MAITQSKIVLKNTAAPGAVPESSFLDTGELSLNIADGILFYKDPFGDIKAISSGSGAVTSLDSPPINYRYEYTTAFTGSNNDIMFVQEIEGSAYKIELVNPMTGVPTPTSASINHFTKVLTVNLGTSFSNVVNATANSVIAAVNDLSNVVLAGGIREPGIRAFLAPGLTDGTGTVQELSSIPLKLTHIDNYREFTTSFDGSNNDLKFTQYESGAAWSVEFNYVGGGPGPTPPASYDVNTDTRIITATINGSETAQEIADDINDMLFSDPVVTPTPVNATMHKRFEVSLLDGNDGTGNIIESLSLTVFPIKGTSGIFGEKAVVTTTNDNGTFYDEWMCINENNKIWEPRGNIFYDYHAGVNLRTLYRQRVIDGAITLEPAYT